MPNNRMHPTRVSRAASLCGKPLRVIQDVILTVLTSRWKNQRLYMNKRSISYTVCQGEIN